MRTAIDILNEQINECDLKFTQKEKLVILWCITHAQRNAIDEAVKVIKNEYPAGLTNTAKYVSDQVLKLKQNIK